LLIQASLAKPFVAASLIDRYHDLIHQVVIATGFEDKLSGFDVRAGYYPELLDTIDAAPWQKRKKNSLAEISECVSREVSRGRLLAR
jgi:hypothetical protein